MIALAFVSAIASSSRAQVITTYPTDHAGIVALHDRELKELKENNKAQESDDLVAILNQLPELILQHPALTATKAGIYNYASVFQRYVKKQSPSSKVFSEKLQPVQDALSKTVSPFFQGMFDTDIARTLSERDDFPSLAASLAASGVSLYDQAFCLKQAQYTEEVHEVALENQAHHALPFIYHPEDGEQLCSQEIASRYALLGTIQAKAGNMDGAKASFQAAIAKHANRDAYLGLEEIDEAEANLVEASEMFTEAYLTGTLTPTMIQKAKDAYTKAHPGSTLSDYERVLHDTYAKSFVNPVNGAAAPPVPSASTHVVLEELFTGSDCEPCVAPDLATDAILSRYNRNQVVVVVYHDNAPGPDPLTTETSVVRHNYYDTHGSTPHVFLDGKEIEVEEGSPAHAQSSFDILTGDMDMLLKKRPLVVAVYHDNAPGPDPLTTTVSEGRGKYYGTGGSTPHVILDGKEIEIEEGPPSHAQSSFDIITRTIDPLLASHPKATLHVTSQRSDNLVNVTVTGKAANLPAKTHLQILLLETEISDTGKNTLRFQPMVVRAAATSREGDLGFSIRKGSFSKSYGFDLRKVEADNLAYYDHYRDGLEKRLTPFIAKGYMTKASIDAMARFREPKNQVHPDRLAVVAFLQTDDTKEVVQSSFTAVVASQEGDKE
jgi:hypothetical protein